MGIAIVAPPTVDAWNWENAQNGALIGGTAGFVAGTIATPGLGTAIGGITGLIAGFIVGGLNDGAATGADNSEAKADYGSYLITDMKNYLAYCDAGAHNMGQLFNTSYFQWVRWAEWEAKNIYNQEKAAGLSHTYNAEKVLAGSGVINATQQFAWATIEAYNAALASWEDLSSRFTGTYAGMSWGTKLTAYQTNQVDQIGVGTVRFGMDIYTIGKMYLPTDQDLIVLGTGTLTVKTANGTTAATIALDSQGVSTINLWKDEGLKVGTYYFEGGQKVIGYGSRMASSTGSATPIVMTLLQDAVTENVTCLSWATAGQLKFDGGIGTYFPLDYYLFVGIADKGGEVGFEHIQGDVIDLKQYLAKIAETQTQVDQATATVSNYAQSFYNLLKATNGNQAAPMPDFLFPDVQSLIDDGYTQEEIQIMFFAYLKAQEEWYKNNAGMDAGDVNISLASLTLKVKGEIYYANGTQIGLDDSIFTPVISTHNLNLTIGNNTWNQAGFVVIWGDGQTPSTIKNMTCRYEELNTGDYLIIDAMWLDNVLKPTVEMKPTSLDLVIVNPAAHNGTQINEWTDMEWIIAHWYYIAIFAGIIAIMAAMIVRNPTIALVGFAILAAGVIGYFVKDFNLATEISKMFKFEIGNEWQNLMTRWK
jgi:hypothetical protein